MTDDSQPQLKTEQFVVFELDQEEYAAPILAITEVVPTLEITPVPNAQPYILGLINLRGKVLPVLDLEKKFGLLRQAEIPRQHIMVGQGEQDTLFGILVDQVKEVLKVNADAIKPPPEILKSKISAEYVTGVIVLENPAASPDSSAERIILILDLPKILAGVKAQEPPPAPNTVQPSSQVREEA